MALLTCNDCGNKISSDSKRCPLCGAKRPMTHGEIFFRIAIGGFLVWGYLQGQKAPTADERAEKAQAEASERAEDIKAATRMHISDAAYQVAKGKSGEAWSSCRAGVETFAQWGASRDWLPHFTWTSDGREMQIVGHDIKMKNGFNVERYPYYQCKYEIASGKTTVISIGDENIGVTFDGISQSSEAIHEPAKLVKDKKVLRKNKTVKPSEAELPLYEWFASCKNLAAGKECYLGYKFEYKGLSGEWQDGELDIYALIAAISAVGGIEKSSSAKIEIEEQSFMLTNIANNNVSATGLPLIATINDKIKTMHSNVLMVLFNTIEGNQ